MLPVLSNRTVLPEIDWVDREFGRMIRRLWGNGEQVAGTISYPVDMWEDDDSVHVSAELPGFNKDDIDVTIEQGMLHITAERKVEHHQGSLLNERRYTRYHRTFSLPTAVDENKVEAQFDNGVLNLTLPKRPEVKPRRIKIC